MAGNLERYPETHLKRSGMPNADAVKRQPNVEAGRITDQNRRAATSALVKKPGYHSYDPARQCGRISLPKKSSHLSADKEP